MEESKEIKIKRFFRWVYKTISTIIVTLIVIIALLFLFFIVHTSVSNIKGKYPKIGLYTIISPSMEPKIKMYDVVVVVKSKDLKIGDVITYYSKISKYGTTPITHRIININEDGTYIAKGDANELADNENIEAKKIVGKVVFKIPQAGKIQFFIASKKGWFLVVLIPTVFLIIYDFYKLGKIISYKRRLKKIKNEH